MNPVVRMAAAGLVLLATTVARAAEPRAGEGEAVPRGEASGPIPVVREHRYRLLAAIRPLLFWTRASTVGGVQLLWRKDDVDRRGYELLIGSDPGRAPLKINRWGWAREEGDPSGSVMLGLMKQTSEESLDEARTRLAVEGRGGHIFKVIRTRVAGGEARAESTTRLTVRDYTYRDLDELWRLVEAEPGSPRVRSARLPEGTRPGFLFALGDLIHETVEAVRASPGAPAGPGRTVTFTFNAALYDLTLRSTEYLPSATYGGRRFERVVRLDFESNRRSPRTRDRFTIVCGTDGPWAEVPVFIRYQPKWWLRTEGVLDEREQF